MLAFAVDALISGQTGEVCGGIGVVLFIGIPFSLGFD
jgi:hypothetical protein